MRIISGARKGKLLHTLEGHDTRPMPDMAKGAIFNIIRSRVAKARVLDLFCGTGTLGMEALSNGADAVVFVEANPAAVSLLKRNIHSIQAEPRTAILPFTAGKAVKQFKNQEEYFDIIFADPPFVAMKYFTQPIKDDSLSMAELVAILQGRLSMMACWCCGMNPATNSNRCRGSGRCPNAIRRGGTAVRRWLLCCGMTIRPRSLCFRWKRISADTGRKTWIKTWRCVLAAVVQMPRMTAMMLTKAARTWMKPEGIQRTLWPSFRNGIAKPFTLLPSLLINGSLTY